MRKLIEMLDFKKLKIGFLGFVLITIQLFQAFLIPLLPIPGKILLDRFQGSGPLEETSLENSPGLLFSFTRFFENMPVDTLLYYVTFMTVSLGLILGLTLFFETLLAARISKRVLGYLRDKLNAKILSRELSYLHSKKKVDLMGRVAIDVEKLHVLFSSGFAVVFKSIPTILLTLAAMLMTDALVAVIFLSIIPILYGATFRLSKPLKEQSRKMRESAEQLQDQLIQSYSLFSMIKSLSSERQVLDDLSSKNKGFLTALYQNDKVAGYFYGSLIFVKALTRGIVLLVGCYFILKGRISFGDFFLFFAYLEALIHPVDEISRFNPKWSKTQVSLKRISALDKELDRHPEISAQGSSFLAEPHFEFRDISFRYEKGSELVFDQLSLDLQGRQLIALIGPSGCGKSTFLNMFNALYKPDQGEVLFNGLSLRDWNLEKLRKEVLLVGQENFLMPGSILDNIRLANPECSEEQAWQALAKVGAESFVASLPKGLDTQVGEGGQGLSGGQSRRLSLARGFALSESKVGLFDEPTAGLDPKTANQVVRSLQDYSRQALVIFSTHRWDEAQFADCVLVFEKGQKPRWAESSSRLGDAGSLFVKPQEF